MAMAGAMEGSRQYSPGQIKLNPLTGEHEDAQGNQYNSTGGGPGWYAPKPPAYQAPQPVASTPAAPEMNVGRAAPSPYRPSISAMAPAPKAPTPKSVAAPKSAPAASVAAPIAAPQAASLPIASEPPKPPSVTSGGGGMGMSEGAAPHHLSGPTSGRGQIGSRMPPSLAALLKYRVY